MNHEVSTSVKLLAKQRFDEAHCMVRFDEAHCMGRFDKAHCMVGKDFGSCITHFGGSFIFSRLERMEFLMFKDAVGTVQNQKFKKNYCK
ncbi:hypothetical protein MANES_08G086111v8 [Manihot esculenta]|uniref:Uncharacterized protein n=1 Tax=Manihot esculenta TaxID=3983 RepID=A0ACB7HBL2_MANES|nr:hypothetical protein MANES_08G086111v8 [Manihot esculenta]